ncbi:MAG: ABC transporter substrate-binding protein [Gemmatimonadetes bacterium]|nr:ABC transporter substrate-binding protein [Gemmatimonadota bacterium]
MAGDLRVALEHPVDPTRAPDPDNASARLVFRQLYQTLVRVDCEGRPEPALAVSWSHDGQGRRWSFTLRQDARFWDGTPVDAQAVARSWTTRGVATAAGGRVGSIVDSVAVVGDRELAVFLTEPSTTVETFDRAELAVTGAGSLGPWPEGSGFYRPLVASDLPPGEIRVVAGEAPPWRGSITFSAVGTSGSSDARSALDRGVDVLVSADPEVLAYARALPGFTTVPLPWSRTYVVAAEETGGEGGTAAVVPVEALERLARGAVRADARPAQPPFWWTAGDCPRGVGAEESATRQDASVPDRPSPHGFGLRIAYPSGDPVARSLAERLVGLTDLGTAPPPWLAQAVPAVGAGSGSLVAATLDEPSLVRAMRDGSALAFVIPVPRAPGGPCVSASLGAGDDVAKWALSSASGLRVTPLLDVRSSAVVRSGITGIGIDGDGTLIFRPTERVR